jgi:parallel beta-helix repeat protein
MKKVIFQFIVLVLFIFLVNFGVNAGCGDLINDDYILDEDLECSGDGLIINANDIILDCNGHKITGNEYGSGILVDNKIGIEIKNCDISGFQQGIYLKDASDSLIVNNELHDNRIDGILIVRSSSSFVKDNEFRGNMYNGISLRESEDISFENNLLKRNACWGVKFLNGINNVLRNNNFIDNGGCLGYSGGLGFLFESNKFNSVIDNVFSGNVYGVYLEYSDENYFEGNEVNGGSSGFVLSYSDNNYFKGNKINGLLNGVVLLYGSDNSVLEDNILCGNNVWDLQCVNGASASGFGNKIDNIDDFGGCYNVEYEACEEIPEEPPEEEPEITDEEDDAICGDGVIDIDLGEYCDINNDYLEFCYRDPVYLRNSYFNDLIAYSCEEARGDCRCKFSSLIGEDSGVSLNEEDSEEVYESPRREVDFSIYMALLIFVLLIIGILIRKRFKL